MSVILRPYQQDVVNKVYNSWNAGNRNVCLVMGTGLGKSVCMSSIALNFHNNRQHTAVVAHRNELVSQMSCHLALAGIPHRIIAPTSTIGQITHKHRREFGQSFVNPSALTAVVGVDTLISRADSLKSWAEQIDLWEIDECFPAGTKITTLNGYKNIEDVKIDDKVLAFNEKNQTFKIEKVNYLFKKETPTQMMSLTLKGHHVIQCTCNHPFWTKRGWIKAEDLTLDDEVLYEINNSEMYNLRKRSNRNDFSQNKIIRRNRSNLLFKRMCKNLSCKNIINNNESDESEICFGTYEIKESSEKTGNKSKNIKHFKSYKTQTYSKRWEWKTITRSGKETFGFSSTFRFYIPMCCKNWTLSGWNLSTLLQNRCRESRIENRNRSRWIFTFFNKKKRTRQEKRRFFDWVRLEDIKIYESRNNGEHGGSYVYNIGVDNFHTYVANGVVVHNCHHLQTKNKWGKAVEMFKNARGLGVTATPNRADGGGLGRWADGFMDDIVIGPTMRWAIDNGYLADYEIVCPKSDINVEDSQLSSNGDWSLQTLKKAARKSKIVGDVVANYIKYALGRRAIVFATDIETAADIEADFNASGIKAVSLNGKSVTSYREQSVELFKTGKIDVLVNVDLFDEGFDLPACDVVIMARPTASLAKFLQQCGRALRPLPGKTALIIDHVSNVIRHGLPDMEREWSLNRRERRAKLQPDPDDIPLTVCKHCLKPYEKYRTVCPYCGFEKPLPEPQTRSIEMVEGDLVLLTREMLERMRRGTVLEAPGDVAARVNHVAGPIAAKGVANRQAEKIAAQAELKEAIAQWAAIERLKGFDDREIYKKFYLTTGTDVLSALDGSHNRQEFENMANRIKEWWK